MFIFGYHFKSLACNHRRVKLSEELPSLVLSNEWYVSISDKFIPIVGKIFYVSNTLDTNIFKSDWCNSYSAYLGEKIDIKRHLCFIDIEKWLLKNIGVLEEFWGAWK